MQLMLTMTASAGSGLDSEATDFGSEVWNTVSEPAKSIVRSICAVKAHLRPLASQLLHNEWLTTFGQAGIDITQPQE